MIKMNALAKSAQLSSLRALLTKTKQEIFN